MWTAEAVLLCALNMLGRSQASFPPIELVNTLPSDVSSSAEAYVRVNDARIYLVTSSASFQAARASVTSCGATNAVRKIASVLIHEEVHLRQGAGERSAYEAQLTILAALGAGVGSPPYQEVLRAMRHTLDEQRRRPAGLMASARP